MFTQQKPLFVLGPVVATPGALAALETNRLTGWEYLNRHIAGDFGEICDDDKRANLAALQSGTRLMSVYTLADGTKLWIITDAEIDEQHNRQATTLLLPDEY